jgi:hypothetical protein
LRGANPGIVGSTLANAAMYPQYLGSEALGLVGGPIASDIGNAVTTVQQVTSGNANDKLAAERTALQEIPIVGEAVANTIAPYKSYVGNRPSDVISSGGNPLDAIVQSPSAALTAQNSQMVSDAYDTAYKQAKAAGKSDLSAQLAGVNATDIVNKTGQMPYDTSGTTPSSNLFDQIGNTVKGIISPTKTVATAPATSILTKDNKVISLTPPTQGNGISAFTNNTWKATTARTVWDAKSAGNLTDQQATDAFTQLGVNPNDARYDSLAHHTDTEKTQYIVSKSPDHQTLLNNLITGRVVGIGGTQVAADGVLTQLYDQGYISQSEEKALKAYKVDSTGKNLMSGVASSSGLTAAQMKAKITTLNSLYKQMSTATKVKTPTMPKIKTPTLSLTTKKRTAKTKNQWFSAY